MKADPLHLKPTISLIDSRQKSGNFLMLGYNHARQSLRQLLSGNKWAEDFMTPPLLSKRGGEGRDRLNTRVLSMNINSPGQNSGIN